jgi:hypothetical protein
VDALAFAAYDAFVHRLHGALERDNQLVYMSFNHPRAIALIQRFQETWARRHFHDERNHPYGRRDTNVWGILDRRYQRVQHDAWELMRAEERTVAARVPVERQSCRDYEAMAARLERLLRPHMDDALTPYARDNAVAAVC